MIGIVCGEDHTVIEFMPVFASDFMDWAFIKLPFVLPESCWGEWGFSFTRRFPQVAVFSGNEMRWIWSRR
jgi:hypothetical protein